ncbi:disulfide bond formation protein DsbA [Alsobacter soli]|uniref:Disulfide bond formation protein DsbA n=1 Tax=Alsobacter soli TaxID=2109933 RepID=A0A2T1HLN6_9HYPH|nr:DsbA family protein [Alsobacter soli]PSC02489.1 disulfide bond formation protein DsbA [Alsobacter soli]
MTRRELLAVLAAAVALTTSKGKAQEAWYALKGDDGRPVENTRIPVEIAVEAESLPGAVRVGGAAADATVIEFFDYNCPYCRKAAPDFEAMLRRNRELRLILVHNPVLSPQSKEAAKVALAVRQARGDQVAYELHRRLFQLKGKVDGQRALAAAGELGLDTAQTAAAAASDAIRDQLNGQMKLAASMGFSATPSFLVAGAGVLGYPGPKAMAGIVSSVRRCGEIAC